MKHIIRAFSLGLITSSLIVGAVYYFIDVKNPKHSEEEVDYVTEVKQQGYFVYEADMEKKITELENEVTSLAAEQAEGDSKSNNKPAETIQLIFTIEHGMQLAEIVDRLERYGFVTNRNEFITYLEENQLTRLIQPGEYLIHNQMAVEAIAAAITKSPKEE
ncbi:hypothetical protein [Gracilibacillus xinjiangensis]|uniref:YceG-like family protein n=1 Tax=Gracilibacillus xinjiangensis TaxID=1193282 RepID=A0ABV8WYQ6_9BACI